MHKHLNQPGYTLLELMVVVSITSVVLGIGLSAYSKSQARQIGSSAKEKILSILFENQKIANIGKHDCEPNNRFTGQKLSFNTPNLVQVQSICEPLSGPLKTLDPIPGITFETSYELTFRALSRGVDLPLDPLEINFQTKNNLPYTITLTSSGAIKE